VILRIFGGKWQHQLGRWRRWYWIYEWIRWSDDDGCW